MSTKQKTQIVSTRQHIASVKAAQTLCPGSMSSVQYAAFLAHFKGKQIARVLKCKSSSELLKLAKREQTPTREQKLAASLACEHIASALKIGREKFWTRKLYAFAAVATMTTRKRNAKKTTSA